MCTITVLSLRKTRWSKHDCQTICRFIGYKDGNFTLGPTARNRTASIKIISPKCQEHKVDVSFMTELPCPGFKANISVGSNVCGKCVRVVAKMHPD